MEINVTEQFDFEIDPYEAEYDRDMGQLKFTASLQEFTGLKMVLKMSFDEPLYVSPGEIQDTLTIKFKNPESFVSVETGQHMQPAILTIPIKKQMPESEFTKAYISVSEDLDATLKIIFWIVLAFNIIFDGSRAMDHFVELINALQMQIHFPMLQVVFPANVMVLYAHILPIVMFDIISILEDTKLDYTNMFEFDDENNKITNPKFSGQMQELGY